MSEKINWPYLLKKKWLTEHFDVNFYLEKRKAFISY